MRHRASDIRAANVSPAARTHEEASPVRDPAKLLRVAHSAVAVSDSTLAGELDEAARVRLAQMWDSFMTELGSAVSDSAMAELRRLLPPRGERVPTEADLRITEAQIVGWLNGLFMGETMWAWMAGVAGEQQLADSVSSALARRETTATAQASPYR